MDGAGHIHTPLGFLIALSLEAVLIILLNISVIISVRQIPTNNKFRVTYILLGNLALTDAGTGVLLLTGQILPDTYRTYAYCIVFLGKSVP